MLVYFILIHTTVNLWTILLGEIVWIALYFGARTICANLYSKFLFTHYGKYVLEEFAPEISKKKQKEYHYSFYSRITKYAILILLFFVPALLISSIMKIDLNLKKPHFKAAINISKIYSFIYPKTPKIYDMEAMDDEGYYAVLIDTKKKSKYKLIAEYSDDTTYEYWDPYQFECDIDMNSLKKFNAGIAYDAYNILGAHKKETQLLCGFSMETEHMLENSREKLRKKNADIIAANSLTEAGAGFGRDTNHLTLITKDREIDVPMMEKEEAADHLLDLMKELCMA